MAETKSQGKFVLFFFGADVDEMSLDTVLIEHGIAVDVVRNEEDAHTMLDEHAIDLVIIQDFSDVYMIRAISAVRDHLNKIKKDVPIVVISYQAGDSGFTQKVFKAGGNYVYSRHYTTDELVPKIQGLLDGNH